MAGKIDARLAELGLTVPEAAAPVANYVAYVQTGSLLFVSGQIALGPDGPVKGHLGGELSVEEGKAAAKLCGLNLIAQAKAACGGDLDRVKRVVKLSGFVASTPDFTEHPAVVNGASDLMAEVFGEAGRHSRAAVGVAALPLGVAVDVEAIFELA